MQLAASLRINAKLSSLQLNDNSIGDEGVTQLAQCLRVNTMLTSLELTENGFGDKGVEQLMECLIDNHTLMFLDMMGNCISDVTKRALQKACENGACCYDARCSGIAVARASIRIFGELGASSSPGARWLSFGNFPYG